MVWSVSLFKHLTKKVPTSGGTYVEALVGQPLFLNPLLGYSENDSVINKFLYNGLFDYDAKGELITDLADRYERSEDGKEYTIFLRRDVKWHDDEQFNADDVIFTYGLIKNKEFRAISADAGLGIFFSDVDIERMDDFTVKFILKEEQFDFLHNLTVGILPQHAWTNVSKDNFKLSPLNEKPIGTGPFVFVRRDVDNDYISSYTLRSYKNYHKDKPLINKVVFNFYPTREMAVEAYNNGDVTSVVITSNEQIGLLFNKNLNKQKISLAGYFAVFLNQKKSVPLAFDEVRRALILATDNESIVNQVFGDIATPVYSPFMEGSFGYSEKYQQDKINIEEANKLLEEKGWKMEDDRIRKKDDDRLEFTLHVSSNQSSYVEIANLLKEQWKQIGVEVNVEEHDKDSLYSDVINPRDFEALLINHSTRFSDPNLISFWHSKSEDSGNNYSGMEDDKLDEILEKLTEETDQEKRKELYEKVQEQIKSENPAIFLFTPGFVFVHNNHLKGVTVERVNSSKGRYADVNLWYLKEKHVLKKK